MSRILLSIIWLINSKSGHDVTLNVMVIKTELRIKENKKISHEDTFKDIEK